MSEVSDSARKFLAERAKTEARMKEVGERALEILRQRGVPEEEIQKFLSKKPKGRHRGR